MSSSSKNNSRNNSQQQGEVQEGDRVSFNIGRNQLEGTVSEVLTSPHGVGGRTAHASKDEPRVAVHYDGTDNDIIRTMDSVEKKEEGGRQGGSQQGSQQQGEVQEGDRVSFNIGRNQLEGTVSEVLTSPHDVGGRTAHASKDEPRVAVHYDGTDNDIIRTMDSVEKKEEGGQQGGSQGGRQGGSQQGSQQGGGQRSSSSGSGSGQHGGSQQGGRSSSSGSGGQGGSQQGGSQQQGELQEGDRVSFNIGRNQLEGTVTEVLTSPHDVGGRVAHASKDEPRVAVQYDGTGTEIIRTMSQIERLEKEGGEEKEFSQGDRVAFRIGQNRLEGTIKQILTSPREVDGRTAHASKEEPRYVIHYDGTNTDLIRTEEGVERMDDEGERMSTDSSGKRKRENDQDAGAEGDDQKKNSSGGKKSSSKEPDSKKQKNSSSGRSRKGTSAH